MHDNRMITLNADHLPSLNSQTHKCSRSLQIYGGCGVGATESIDGSLNGVGEELAYWFGWCYQKSFELSQSSQVALFLFVFVLPFTLQFCWWFLFCFWSPKINSFYWVNKLALLWRNKRELLFSGQIYKMN